MIDSFHAVPYHCVWLLNIGLNTEIYLYDLKMCDTDYRYVTDSIFRHSRLSDILSCDKLVELTDSDCIYIYIYISLND